MLACCVALLWPPEPVPADTSAEAGAGAGCPVPGSVESEDWPGQRRWQALEQAGYRLGDLDVVVRDVYVGEDLAWYQQLANTLHTETHPSAIHDLLTVARGDTVDAEHIYEAERVLRSQSFLNEARLVPVRCEGDTVATEVRVRDAWTLQVGVGLGVAGGESNSSFSFEDENFFGTGKTVLLDWREDSERTTVEFGYEDPAVFRTPWTLDVSHRELSDGSGDTLAVAYPFRRADQAWGFDASIDDADTEIDFEHDGETAYATRVERQQGSVELRRLIARDDRGGWRAGLGWRRDYADYGTLEEEAPELRPAPNLEDRRLQGPFLSLEHFNDRYKSFRNLRSIGKTEDYDLGFDARFSGGRYIDSAADDNPWFFGMRISHGMELGERDLLLTRVNLSGRYREDGGLEAWYRSFGGEYYHRTSDRNTIVLHAEADWRHEPDPEGELYLGGFDGLLAYPDRFRVGDRRWLVHLEDRYVSETVLFDTIQLGYTAYLEAGNIRGLDGQWGETLSNVGAGLRLGSLRSSFGAVSYLTVAVPLVDAGQEDDYTLVVGSTVNF